MMAPSVRDNADAQSKYVDVEGSQGSGSLNPIHVPYGVLQSPKTQEQLTNTENPKFKKYDS